MAQDRSIANSVSRHGFVLTGVSLLAIAAMGAAAPASAQDVPREQTASPSHYAAQPTAPRSPLK
jgi:hypothetical protein